MRARETDAGGKGQAATFADEATGMCANRVEVAQVDSFPLWIGLDHIANDLLDEKLRAT